MIPIVPGGRPLFLVHEGGGGGVIDGTDPGHGARRGMGQHVPVDGESDVRIRMAEDPGGRGDVAVSDQVAGTSVPDVMDPGIRRQSGVTSRDDDWWSNWRRSAAITVGSRLIVRPPFAVFGGW